MPWVDVDNYAGFELTKEEEKELEIEEKKKTKLRFYVDADVPELVIQILREEKKTNVLTAQEAGRRTHSDEAHIAEALKQNRILLTCDKDYLNDQRFPLNKCPTVIVCDFGTGTKEQIIDTFDCLSTIEWAPQLFTREMKIHAKPSHWTETIRSPEGFIERRRFRFHKGKKEIWVE